MIADLEDKMNREWIRRRGEPQMNTDRRRYGLVRSRSELSEIYLRTSALICGWTFHLGPHVNSRPFVCIRGCNLRILFQFLG
jgi:hypothetical protein